MRVAVIGDVGGYAGHLEDCLGRLGVRGGVAPDDLHIVQVGDLVGGVDDRACVDLAAPLVAAGRWTQVVGNWEVAAVGGRRVSRQGRRPDRAALARIAMWGPAVRFAVAVRSDNGRDGVVTHAGLTRDWLERMGLDGLDAAETADRVNGLAIHKLERGGEMAGQPPPACPIWATTGELWSSWAGHRPPWAQVHGHSAIWTRRQGWAPWVPEELRGQCRWHETPGHASFFADGPDSPPLIGIDCSLWDDAPPTQLAPLVFDGEVLA